MSFQFGFSNGDLSDDELNNSEISAQPVQESNAAPSQVYVGRTLLDSPHLQSNAVKQPNWESLDAILQSLKDVRLSFEKFSTPQNQVPIYRRELFDVKHQLMTEADELTGSEAKVELEILMGETNEDVRKNVYEGGLKSWECSIDLVDALATSLNNEQLPDTIIELGCGTSLPTEYLFMKLLESNCPPNKTNFILSDYNESVLRLVTIPNFIIAWANIALTAEQRSALQQQGEESLNLPDDELLLSSDLLLAFREDLSRRNINLSLISGAWSRRFNDMVLTAIHPNRNLLILSSETIYQPETLPVISEVLIELLSQHKQQSKYSARALVAAKDIYFGVGGSIIEFQHYLESRIREDALNLSMQILKVNAGLKRSIVVIE